MENMKAEQIVLGEKKKKTGTDDVAWRKESPGRAVCARTQAAA